MLSQIGKGLHRSLAQRLCSGELWGLRQIQKKAEEFSSSFLPLPPVSFHEESGAPTVLQWLRRRGPPVSEACRNRLVRDKKVRLLEDGRLRQIGASVALQQGSQLLIPRTAVAHWQAPKKARFRDARTEMLEDALLQHLKGSILYKDSDMLIVNKPAGLPVQGGDGIRVSVDSLLPQLTFGAAERPRLVHRLDRNTSGALILARSRDSATRLSQAFRQASSDLSSAASGAEPSDGKQAGPAVQKLYIAIVEESTRLEDSGFVGPTVGQMQGAPTAKSGDPDDAEPSLTHYTTLARCPQHFALLALQPITGRKHQLRKACGRVLQAPVVGDGRYGQQRSAEQLWFNAQLDLLPREEADRPEEALGRMLQCNRHLQLHCFQMRVQDADGFHVETIAPLPSHMRKAIRMLFRGLPEDLDAQLPKFVKLADLSGPQALQRALASLQRSVAQRQHQNSPPSRSPLLPRTSHVELPADPKFKHLAGRSSAEKQSASSRRDEDEEDSEDVSEDEGSESDSDGEPNRRRPRWTSAQKKEAKEKRRVLKKARREKEKEKKKLLDTPLRWDE